MIDNLVGSLTGKSAEKSVMATGLNGKARDAFGYLVRESGLSWRMNVEHVIVSGPIKLPAIECAVVGADEKTGAVVVPNDQLTFNEIGKIAIVMFNGESVKGVYVFPVDDTVLKPKLFSRFKRDKKTGDVKISTKGLESCEENKFGMVFSDYIVKGV